MNLSYPRFGPAGAAESFAAMGYKSTLQMPAYLAGFGLDWFEYQCGRGVAVSEEKARQLGAAFARQGIGVSLHAPYYISLASKEPEKRDNSVQYILQSARAVDWLGGDRIVVHPGGLGGLSRADATALACTTLQKAQQCLDENGLSHVHICPETMGKINQLGDLDEVLTFCGLDERMLPCVDFGHLNARTHGGLAQTADFAAVLTAIENKLGSERLRSFHIHFSKIEYTDGGEKRHLTFADTVYGPNFEPLADLLAAKGLAPAVVCESAGTQTEDAQTMQQTYRDALA